MTCAFAVRGALKKFPGVDSVDVSLNKGTATVILRPGNTVEIQQLWEAIKKNGFTPRETRVVVRGIAASGIKTQLNVTGTRSSYELVPDPKAPKAMDNLKGQAGKLLTIEGTLTPGRDVITPISMQVQKVRP